MEQGSIIVAFTNFFSSLFGQKTTLNIVHFFLKFYSFGGSYDFATHKTWVIMMVLFGLVLYDDDLYLLRLLLTVLSIFGRIL